VKEEWGYPKGRIVLEEGGGRGRWDRRELRMIKLVFFLTSHGTFIMGVFFHTSKSGPAFRQDCSRKLTVGGIERR